MSSLELLQQSINELSASIDKNLELLAKQFEDDDCDVSHIVVYCSLDVAIQELNDANALMFAHRQANQQP